MIATRMLRSASSIVLALAMAACTNAAPSASGPDEASSSAGQGNAREFTVAFTSIGIASVPLLAAIEDLQSQGYEIEVVEIAESDLVIQGVSSGDYAISSAGAPPIAIAQGAELKVFVDRNSNEFTLYATSDISTCADLDGRTLAIHSEGATSTAMVRDYISTECPGTEPEYVVIAGSPNRYAALVAGEIDASPLELSEAVALEDEAGDRFGMVTSFAQSLPSLHNANVYGNADFVDANPETVKDLIRALLAQHRQIAGDAAYLEQLVAEHWPDAPSDILQQASERYVDLELFDVNGGLTEENIQSTIDFYSDAGLIEGELSVSDMADLSYLAQVIDEIGRE